MVTLDLSTIIIEQHAIASTYLNRYVIVDFYLPKNIAEPDSLHLLLINDGQNLEDMQFGEMINTMILDQIIKPVLCAGIHAGKDRKREYGTAGQADYAGRGDKAGDYSLFILEELMPFIHQHFAIHGFRQRLFAGFSLGGLTAIDLTWKFPEVFSVAGIFSGSLWWRSHELNENYNDDQHRIMHQIIRHGNHFPGLKFYFTTGSLDEKADRNNNGIIDSIDDTLDLIKELEAKGYDQGSDLKYINYEDGQHDISTWARAFPDFLKWCL